MNLQVFSTCRICSGAGREGGREGGRGGEGGREGGACKSPRCRSLQRPSLVPAHTAQFILLKGLMAAHLVLLLMIEVRIDQMHTILPKFLGFGFVFVFKVMQYFYHQPYPGFNKGQLGGLGSIA